MQQTFPRRQGTTLTPNATCFINFFFFNRDTTDALKASLASALRHSRDQAEKTYDRRTANERKECAVRVTREYAQEIISNPAMTETTQTSTSSVQAPTNTNIKVAKFVALIEEASTLKSPKILIGQVQSFIDNAKVSLLWYKAHKNNFKLELDGQQWIEDVNCCVPVSMTPVRNKPGLYRLNNSLRAIHKSLTSKMNTGI